MQIKLLTETAKVPTKATRGSAGYDIYADEPYLIKPNKVAVISTGIAVSFSEKYKLEIVPRSGLAFKHGISVINSPGTIDSDYCAEIKVGLIKHTEGDYLVQKGDRIAQMILVPIKEVINFEVVKDFDCGDKNRGGGFGSSGK